MAVCGVLLAYGTTRLPSGKWLLIMKVERSTCNYSTPVVCVYMLIRLVGSIWNTFSRHSRANLALKAFPARVYGLKFGPSKIISYSRILLIKALSTFAELRAWLKGGWRGRGWGCRPYPTLSFAVFNLYFTFSYYSCAWQLKKKKGKQLSDSASPVLKTLVDLLHQTLVDTLHMISWLWMMPCENFQNILGCIISSSRGVSTLVLMIP